MENPSLASMFTGQQIVDALRNVSVRNKGAESPEGVGIAKAIMDNDLGKLIAQTLGSERMGGMVAGMLVAFELLSGNSETVN